MSGIVSLLASGTEIVHLLGLDDRLVGISHECDHPLHLMDRPRVSRPRFDPAGLDSAGIDRAVRDAMAEHGSVYRIDADLLARLRPELILTQAVCEVCAVPTPGVRETVADLGLDARILSLDAHTLPEILATIRAVGEAAEVADRANQAADALDQRLVAVAEAVASAPRPRVLAIEWLDPPFVPGHWVPEQIERAGGDCLRGRVGARSVETGWDALAGLDPDVLVVMPCGYGLEASCGDADAHADRLLEVAPRAVAERRAFVVDGSSYFNRSGPRAVDGVEILAGLLHPDRWPAREDGAVVWSPTGVSRPG
jgi:iron complex transport system substrate-binding protein